MIPIDVVHKFDNKVPCKLKIPVLNINNNIASITKSTALVSLRLAENVNSIFSLDLGHITSNQTIGSGGSSGSTDPRTGTWPTPWNATN